MRKPELEDYGLSKSLLHKYKQQEKLADEKLESYIQTIKDRCNTIGMISIIILFITFFIFAATGFSETGAVVFGIPAAWLGIYWVPWVQSRDYGWSDVSYEKRKELHDSVVDEKLEKAVRQYEKALLEYEKSLKINEYSVVRASLCLPFGDEREITTQWIVFSNIHLANPRSFPDIRIPRYIDDDFKDYYDYLITKQSSITPKPKKALNITGELKFFYPCSDLFLAFKGKKPGDSVFVNGVTKYKILEVINFD